MKRLRRKFGVVLAVFGVIATFVLSIAVASSPAQAASLSCTAWDANNARTVCTITTTETGLAAGAIAGGSYTLSATGGKFSTTGTIAADAGSITVNSSGWGIISVQLWIIPDTGTPLRRYLSATVPGPDGVGSYSVQQVTGDRPDEALTHIRDYSLENAPVVIGIIGAIFSGVHFHAHQAWVRPWRSEHECVVTLLTQVRSAPLRGGGQGRF